MTDERPPERYAWSLAYPVFIWLIGLLTALWIIAPQFLAMYERLKVPMSTFTVEVLSLSQAVAHWPVAWALGSLALRA